MSANLKRVKPFQDRAVRFPSPPLSSHHLPASLILEGQLVRWGEGDKTVREQRQEIKDAMERAINTEVVYKEIEEYNPTLEKYDHIKAITYDAFEYQGKKTKVFAYVGFPEGASAEDPVPAVVLVHGNGGHPYMEWIRLWNARGYAAIAMEISGYFPSEPNVGVTENQNGMFVYGMHGVFLEEGYTDSPDRSFTTEYAEVEDQWLYHGLTHIILAHNILRQDERVDNDNIGVTGIPLGGMLTSQLIGYDTRFSFAIPVYGTAYLGDETRPYREFAHPYVDALWAAERNLDNAKMPILWLTYADDVHFGVPSYVKSYMHTKNVTDKTALLMITDWGHSHNSVFKTNYSFLFADWVTFDRGGVITFETEPEGREINCKINIPEDNKEWVSAVLYYITEPMSYSEYDKFGKGVNMYLDQEWKKNQTCLKVDVETGTVTGTIPEDAKGYYIQLFFFSQGESSFSSSSFVNVE